MTAAKKINKVQQSRSEISSGNLVQRTGAAAKAITATGEEGWIEGYLVSWGSNNDTDLQGEHFTPRTEFCLDWFGERPVLYHHGMDEHARLRTIGKIKAVEPDDLGLWVQAQLDLRDRYAAAVYDMVKSQEFGWSSGSIDHLVKIAPNGEIIVWPLIEGSITPTPAQPSKTTVRPFKSIAMKSVIDSFEPDYLKELSSVLHDTARVEEGFIQRNGLLVPDSSFNLTTKSYFGDTQMASRNSLRAAKRLTQKMGIRNATPAELEAVASEMEEVAQMSDPETEAALASLEEEMVGGSVASIRGRRNLGRSSRSPRSSRSYRRGYRADDLAPEMATQMGEIAEEVATQMAEEIATQMAEELDTSATTASIRGRRNFGRRSPRASRSYRRGFRSDEVLPEAVMGDEELLPAAASYRGRRSTTRRGYRADEIPQEAVMADEELDQVAAASYRTGFRRGLRTGVRNTDVLAEAPIGKADETVTETTDAARSYRRGYRAAMNRISRMSRRKNFGEDTSVSSYNDAEAYDAMVDDEATMSDDEQELITGKNFSRRSRSARSMGSGRSSGRNRAVRSADMGNNETENWRRRAIKAELMEAPGQRSFKASARMRDAADTDGGYTNAFKAYIYNGLAGINDTEKHVLRSKGRVDWNDARGTFAYDSATKSTKAYLGGTDASAGFAVPPEWVAELNKNIASETVMAGECRARTTTSDLLVQTNLESTDARRSHAARVRWARETPTQAQTDATEDQYTLIEIPVHLMMLSKAVSNTALEDVNFSLEDEITEAFSEAVGVAYDETIYAGDGQGKLQGITTSQRVIAAESTGTASASGYIKSGSNLGLVNADVLKKMLFHLPRQYRQKAKWYMNENTGLQIATLTDANGNYLIDNRDEALRTAGIPDMLLGKPIVYNYYASDIAQNAFPIVLADLTRGYTVVKRVDFQVRRFDDSYYGERDQVLFVGRARLGGQPVTHQAIKVLKITE